MPVTYINPENHTSPAGMYSHVAIAEPGRFAFIAGQLALDTDGSIVGLDDAGAQFRQAFSNLTTVLQGIGARPTDIVELRTFLVGAESLTTFRPVREDVYAEHFPDGMYPPNTLLIVNGLAQPGLKVEISAAARLPD